MEIKKGPKKLRKITGYLPGFIKFYSLKSEYIAPIVFIFILGAIFARYALQPQMDKAINIEDLTTYDYKKVLELVQLVTFPMIFSYFLVFAASFLSRLISGLYFIAYIRDLKGEIYSLKSSLPLFFRSIHRITFTSVEFYMTFLFGLLLLLSLKIPIAALMLLASLFIPGVIGFVFLKIVFIFGSCFIVDKGKGVLGAIESSIVLTRGSRSQIFLILAVFVVFGGLISFTVTSLFSSLGNMLAISFVYAFVSTIVDIMQTRLVAQMYVDLEYGQAVDEEEEE